MLARVLPLEDGKDLLQATQSRALSVKTVKIFLLFLALAFAFSAVAMYRTRYSDVKNAIFQYRPPRQTQRCVGDGAGELGRWIRPPSSLVHNMSDEELLWRASFVPQREEYPYERVPKVAFMFLTKGPLPLSPLWDRFFKGHEELYSVYVHSLPSYKAEHPPSSAFYQRQIPSQVVEWGEMSMCDAERRLLANALLDMSNERFVLLSESCVPLYNFSIVYQYLIGSHHSFVGSFDEPGPFGRGRYNPKMVPEINPSQWSKGPQWFEVNRKLAATLVSDTKYYPKFKEFCQPPCFVDEHYFPTMLSIETPQLIANRSVTFTDWSRGGPHPATFGKEDITEEFLKKTLEGQECLYNGQPSSLCTIFARKFAPSCLEPLLNFTDTLLGFN